MTITADNCNLYHQRQAEQLQLLQYQPLVNKMVNVLSWQCHATFEREDMQQVAQIALLECLRKHQGQCKAQFLRYASTRIRGAILDEMRKLDWRPREIRSQIFRLDEKIKHLTQQNGELMSAEQICTKLNLSQEDYLQLGMSAQSNLLVSLEEMLEQGESLLCQDVLLEEHIRQQSLIAAIDQISPRLQTILSLYYQHGLNLKDIATSLGLTDIRLYQLHKAAITQLHDLLIEH